MIRRKWLQWPLLAITGAIVFTASAPKVFGRNTCSTYTKGNEVWERYCPGDQRCIGPDKCELSPEQKKVFEDLRRGIAKAIDEHKRRAAEAGARGKFFGELARRARRREQAERRLQSPPSGVTAKKGAPTKQTVAQQTKSRGYGRCPQPVSGFDCSCPPTPITAAWHYVCRPNVPTRAASRYSYRESIITPQALYHRAAQSCQGAAWAERDRCVMLGKVRILMELSPQFRAACSGSSDDEQIRCVDELYVQEREPTYDELKARIAAIPDTIGGPLADQLPPGD